MTSCTGPRRCFKKLCNANVSQPYDDRFNLVMPVRIRQTVALGLSGHDDMYMDINGFTKRILTDCIADSRRTRDLLLEYP